jgi:arylsulfatase A-like enzyme
MLKVSRRDALAVCGGALLTAASAGFLGVAVKRKRPKNVILIVSDALRADRLGCYGYRCKVKGGFAAPTPHIDRLAENGLLFERCIAHSSWTLSSVLSIMASAYPTVGGGLNQVAVPADSSMLAEAFRAAGYSTQALIANTFLSADTPCGSAISRSFDRYDMRLTDMVENPLRAQGIGHDKVYQKLADARDVLAEAVKRISGANAAGRSVFMYIHLMDTHEPYNAARPYLNECPAAPMKNVPDFMLMTFIRHYAYMRHQLTLTDQAAPLVRRLSGLYDASVRYLDAAIGETADGLASAARHADTVVALTSDHGEEFAEHKWIGHAETLYQESLHVPLLLWGAGVPRGQRVETLVSSLDIAPSLLTLSGLPVPGRMIGTGKAFSGADVEPKPCISALARPAGAPVTEERVFSLCDPRGLKLVRREYVGPSQGRAPVSELYDLRTDSREETNICPTNPGAASAMAKHLRLFADNWGSAVAKGPDIDEETRRKLEALGYLGR